MLHYELWHKPLPADCNIGAGSTNFFMLSHPERSNMDFHAGKQSFN